MEAHFQKAGFSSAEEIYETGLEESYRRIVEAGMRPHFMAFLAFAAGLEGRSWNGHSDEEKEELRLLHNQIVNEKSPKSELEAFMNKIGLRE